MVWSRRPWLVGRERVWYRRVLWPIVAVFVLLLTFAAYATGLFTVSGGIVWIPGDAALVGFTVAALVGYDDGGLISAWFVSVAALLGYRADYAFTGLSYRTRLEQAAYFFQLEGLLIFVVEALVIGSLAFLLGAAVRRATSR
ncbi:MAG: hypothetical protein ABEI27_03735 [Halobellus sp.]|uniref:hypothetical protein n=1 Tax=Halobellus sp. TaxID=1979212 RepID=UPI0035D448F2